MKKNNVKKNNAKKLVISRETIVRLNAPELVLAAAGAWSEDSICPTTAPSDRFCA